MITRSVSATQCCYKKHNLHLEQKVQHCTPPCVNVENMLVQIAISTMQILRPVHSAVVVQSAENLG